MSKAQGVLNPAYMSWQHKDQTVLSWIISSLSPSVVSTVYGLETSRLAWQALASRFAAQSKSRISHIKSWQAIDDEDLITYVLNGLTLHFQSFVTSYMLVTREKSMTFSDFQAELLNYDLMLRFHDHTIQPETGSYALYTNKAQSKPGSCNNKGRSSPKRSMPGSSSQFRHPLPHLPTAKSSPPHCATRSKSPCQICKKDNHQALDYFNRMNYAFQGRHPPPELAAMVAEANT
ncbi:uncharacterized protein LOC120106363 [Phoenix dactylifera]|uniref:Uncharacterized protein LOC120106363 n=1 Tax=Phoenix dactylifera TaxID=42345 RepID=A0A8B8ZM53_PHODC|nr:uncharacterized protein LOC120106363 [Phoenix dactylifera]